MPHLIFLQVSLRLEGIRNNATGLDEQQMLEVIDEVLTSALRNSVLDVNFQSNKTFPKFRRARQAPDPIIPVGYDSMVRELQTHPPSASRKPKKREFVPLHNEELVEAGESFTALPFSSTLSQHINLTLSEEQLIARNLHKYPSLENAEMEPDEISDFCKSWEENYVPAAEVHNEEQESSEACVTDPQTDQKEDSQTKNFVLVATNRSKLIDEPRITACVENEEEEPEIELALNCNVENEPCIRRGSRSPLLLGKPTIEESVQPEEEEEDTDEPLQLDKMDFTDKSLTGTSGFGPLPSLPGLQKGPFVSGACCVGVEINVAAEVPELELRVNTEAIDDSVACDLFECDQEVVEPVQPLLQTQLHNQSVIDDLSLCSVSDAANTPSDSQREPNPSPTSFPSLEPATSSASALSALMGNRDEENESGFSLVGNRSKTGDDLGYLWDTSWVNSVPSTQDSSTLVYEHVKDDTNTSNGSYDREDLESNLAYQVLPVQVTDPKQSEQPLIFQPDNFQEEGIRSIDECMNEIESVHEVCKFVNTDTEEDESGYKKICLNEFTESLFKHIESEVSLSEEIVDDPAWEMAEVYETSDGSPILSDSVKEDEESEEFGKGSVCEVKKEQMSSFHEVRADAEDSEISFGANMVWHQEYEAEIHDTKPVSGDLDDDENEIIPSGYGKNENNVQEFHSELSKDYDTPEETCKEANMQDSLAEPVDRNSGESSGLSTAICHHYGSEEMEKEKENIKKVMDGVLCNSPLGDEEISKLADVDERVEDQSLMDKIHKLDIEEKAVEKETHNNEACDESLFEELDRKSTEVEEIRSSTSKEKLQSPSGDHQKFSSVSPEMVSSDVPSNDTKEPTDEQSEYLDSVLHELQCRGKFDTEPNPIMDVIDDKDPFSPDDDDFRYHDENLTCGCHHECKCTHGYTLIETSSDSEVEGITGKHPGKEEHSPSERNWRNSDIDLIVEAESFLVPGGYLDSAHSCNVKEAQELPESVPLSHTLEDAQASPQNVNFSLQDAQVSAQDSLLAHNLQDAEILPQNSILRQSEEESQPSPQDKLLSDTSRDIEESHQETKGIEVQSNILSFSEGSLLTTKTHNVAALTQPDTTPALTAQQGKSHTRKDYTTGDDFMKDLPLTSGRPQWTRPLPSYPVYGAYFVVRPTHLYLDGSIAGKYYYTNLTSITHPCGFHVGA